VVLLGSYKKTSAIHEEGQFLRLAEADPLRKTG
jgi:hypothetical protein